MVALPLLRPARRRALVRALVVAVVFAVPVLGLGPAPAGASLITPVQMVRAELQPTNPRSAGGMHTATVVADAPFAMVGLDMPTELAVEVRTADGADGDWSAWTPLAHSHDEGPDPGSDEALAAARVGIGEQTHPLFTGPADRIQVRSPDAGLADAELVLIDSLGLSRTPAQRALDALRTAWAGTPGTPANAIADRPPIVTRAGWGADETITRRTYAARQVDRIFVHHTVGSNSYGPGDAPGVVRGVQAYHVNSRGWSDIGYNFLVDRFGTIYEGRAGGIENAVIGAQAGGFNTSSAGIALMGTFTAAAPPAAATDAVEALAAWLADHHHFPADGTSEALSRGSTRYPDGQVVLLDNLSGHRDVSATSCPGDGTYPLLPAMRPRVDAAVGDQIIDHDVDHVTARAIRGDPDVDAITATATLDPPGEWTVQAAAPDGRLLMRATGDGAVATGALPMEGDGWALGDYTFTFASPGRRDAVTTATLVPPVIVAPGLSAQTVTTDLAGATREPLRFSATLWDQASWQLDIAGPDGAPAVSASGVGDRLDHAVTDLPGPGTYTWTMLAEDAEPVAGSFDVRVDILDRIADTEDPAHASVLVSQATFGAGQATRAVIARSDVFADALAGGPLAGPDGPLLLTASDVLDVHVSQELARALAPGATIFVLGGEQAITPGVAADLSEFGTVRRLAGTSRIDTAARVAGEVIARSGATTAMVARAGPDDAAPWADALAGGAWGAENGVPVLLSLTSRLSDETAQAMTDLGITQTIVLGGPQAISDSAMAAMPAPRRVAGADRHGTAALVARDLWGADGPVTRITLANGIADGAWAWALSAAPLAARTDAPLLLSGSATLPDATAAVVGELPVDSGVLIGPASLVGDDVRHAVGARAAAR